MKPVKAAEIPREQRDIWTVKDVAEYLGYHERTVKVYAERNEIPAKKIGSEWRFSREKIRALV